MCHYSLHITWASLYFVHRAVRDFYCVIESYNNKNNFSEVELFPVFKLPIFILLRDFVLFNLWETEVLNFLVSCPSSVPESSVSKTAKCVFIKFRIGYFVLGTAVAQWLRCCATNRKVAGSIPAGVSGFFIDIKSFRSHYGPGVDSVSNRNEYQKHFLGVKAAGA